MPYKELTIDFVLGRVLVITTDTGVHRWRVLEYYPMPLAQLRVILVADERVRSALHWPTVQTMIAAGLIQVE
jgi:hypothetical protein